MIEDTELLRRYVNEGSESDFADFVSRHIDFVYGCALRRVGGDAHLAEDVAQQVFVAVARKARELTTHPVLAGWLFTATRNVAAQCVRTERRRQIREQEASAMNDFDEGRAAAIDWDRLRPVIDLELDRLSGSDREAVLLHFFEGKTFAEIGNRLRLAENTARMRVSRALDKLSDALNRRGIRSTAAALAVGLAGPVGISAPVGLASTVTGVALAGAATTGGGVAAVVFMGMSKLQIGIAAALAIAAAGGLALQANQISALRHSLAQADGEIASGASVLTENAQLVQARRAGEQAATARATELLRLQDEAATLRRARAKAAAAKLPTVQAGRTAVAAMQIYDPGALDRMPTPKVQGPPAYPFALRQSGTQGEAMVDFVVDADGAVQNAHAVDGTDPAFVDAAVAAIRQWQFQPARKGGKSVAVHLQMPIVFTLQDDDAPEANHAATKPSLSQPPWF